MLISYRLIGVSGSWNKQRKTVLGMYFRWKSNPKKNARGEHRRLSERGFLYREYLFYAMWWSGCCLTNNRQRDSLKSKDDK
jgi:hypothetical protein